MKLTILGCSVLAVASCSTISSLINGVSPQEGVTADDVPIRGPGEGATYSRTPDGLLTVSVQGFSLQVNRSTGVQVDTIRKLEDLVEKSVGNKYRILASLKNGGRILTLRNERILEELIEAQKQNQSVSIDGQLVDESQASFVLQNGQALVLEPLGMTNVRITRTGDGVGVRVEDEIQNITITTTKGLNPNQVKKLRDNFAMLMAQRINAVTGLPIKVVAFLTSGRDRIISRLMDLTPGIVDIQVNGEQLEVTPYPGGRATPLSTPGKQGNSSWGGILQGNKGSSHGEGASVIRGRDGSLRVVSPAGGTIRAFYSSGLPRGLVSLIADTLHRAITLRVNLISWSNKLIGSVPPELENAMSQVFSLIQKRVILVDGREVDLGSLSLVTADEDSSTYRLPGGSSLRASEDEVTLIGRGLLEVRLTPGIPLGQASKMAQAVKDIVNLVLPSYNGHNVTESVLNNLDRRKIVGALAKGVIPDVWIKVEGEQVNIPDVPYLKSLPDRSVYGTGDNVTIHKYDNGDFGVETKRGSDVLAYSSTGLTVSYLRKLADAIEDYGGLDLKRSFANHQKVKYFAELELLRLVNEIPSLVHNITIHINGQKVDIESAAILRSDYDRMVYRPSNSRTGRVTLFEDGSVGLDVPDDVASVAFSRGITMRQADTLREAIKLLVGKTADVSLHYPSENVWPSEVAPTRTLVSGIGPRLNVTGEGVPGKRGIETGALTHLRTPSGGVNVTGTGGKGFKIAFSSGLSVASTGPLVAYLESLLKDKQDVINMNLGSLSAYKERHLKEEIQKLAQKRSVFIDGVRMTRSNSKREHLASGVSSYRPSWAPDVSVRLGDVDEVQVSSDGGHVISVVISPGLSPDQVKELEANVRTVFKKELSRITKIPVEVFDFITGTKERLVHGVFHLAALPMESLYINGTHLGNLTISGVASVGTPEGGVVFRDPSADGVSVTRYTDGSLGVEAPSPGRIEVARSTGVSKEDAQRLLAGMRAYMESKVKTGFLNRNSDSEPLMGSLEGMLDELVAFPQLSVSNNRVDLSSALVLEKSKEGTVYRPMEGLILSHYNDGRVAVNSSRVSGDSIQLNVTRGVTRDQAEYLREVLKGILDGKLDKLQIVANLPSLMLQLLAQGKLKPVQEVVEAALPEETVVVDGRSMKTPVEGGPPYEPADLPGVRVTRGPDGSLDVDAGKGGSLEVASNSGLSKALLDKIAGEMKSALGDHLAPVARIVGDLVKGNFSDLVEILTKTELRDINAWLKNANLSSTLLNKLVKSVAQNQTVLIDGQPVDLLRTATVVSSDAGGTVYSPIDHPSVRITRRPDGSLVLNTAGREDLRVILTRGIPPGKAEALLKGIKRVVQMFKSVDSSPNKIYSTAVRFGEKLYDTLSKGLGKEEEVYVDGKPIAGDKLIKVEEGEEYTAFRVDGEEGVRLTRFKDGRLGLETSGGQEIEAYASSGLDQDLVSHLAATLQSLNVTMENITLMVSDDAHLIGSPLKNVFDALLQSRRVYVGGAALDLGGPGWAGEATAPNGGRKAFVDVAGRVTVLGGEEGAEVEIGAGLSPKQMRRLKANLGSLLRPDRVLAAALDAVPDRVYATAANLERIMPFLGLFDI